MSESLNPGDVVQVKSGGPKMTVITVGDNYGSPVVWCEWFDEKGEPKKSSFAPSSVTKV